VVQGSYAHGVLECALEISGRNLRQREARDELCAAPGTLWVTPGYYRLATRSAPQRTAPDQCKQTKEQARPGAAHPQAAAAAVREGRTVDVVRLELRDAARAGRCEPCGRACKHGGTEARVRDRHREPVDLIRSRLGCRRLASDVCAGADPSTEGLPSTHIWHSEYCECGTDPPHGNQADASTHVLKPLGRRRSLQCSPSRAAPGFHSDTALARTSGLTAPARAGTWQRVRSRAIESTVARARLCDRGLGPQGVL
jgi:hypothetical protein